MVALLFENPYNQDSFFGYNNNFRISPTFVNKTW